MSNLERPRWHCHILMSSTKGWQVQLWLPESLKRCRLYLLSSCLGRFIFMIFFLFVFFLAFFSFFPPVCMCLCVLSFRLGWESAGCSCLL